MVFECSLTSTYIRPCFIFKRPNFMVRDVTIMMLAGASILSIVPMFVYFVRDGLPFKAMNPSPGIFYVLFLDMKYMLS